MLHTVKPRSLTLFALLAGLLTACPPAPSGPTPTVGVSTAQARVTFYPFDNGLEWRYLNPGDPVTAAPYVRKGQGARLLGDTVTQTMNQVGRGADTTWYRTFEDSGVYLHGLTKPGVTVLLSPPWREYPAPGDWKVGLRWSGSSTITLIDEVGKSRDQVTGTYVYTVLEQRDVTVAGTPHRVWVINRQITGGAKNLFPETNDFWFVPYVGEVKTPEGLVLTGANFPLRRP